MKRTYKDSTELNPEPRGQYELYKGLGYTIPEALADLIDNSIDANATEAMIRFIRTDKTLEAIQVIDNGEGIEQSILKNIGTPFMSTKAQGSGLGLAVVLAVSKAHSGRLDIETLAGNGTCVTMHLNSTAAS